VKIIRLAAIPLTMVAAIVPHRRAVRRWTGCRQRPLQVVLLVGPLLINPARFCFCFALGVGYYIRVLRPKSRDAR